MACEDDRAVFGDEEVLLQSHRLLETRMAREGLGRENMFSCSSTGYSGEYVREIHIPS